MDLKSALNTEIINYVAQKNMNNNSCQVDSASSLEDSSDAESIKLNQLKIEDDYGDIIDDFGTQKDFITKSNFSTLNKFADLISNENSTTENIEKNLENDSCSSIDSLNSNQKSPDHILSKDLDQLSELKDMILENNEIFPMPIEKSMEKPYSIKRAHLKNLIYELYDLSESCPDIEKVIEPEIIAEGVMEKLPLGKTLKNSILLAWKKRYFKLNSIGLLNIYEITSNGVNLSEPVEFYNLMGARVTYEQDRVITLDDCRGNCIVFRCFEGQENENTSFQEWKTKIESQIIDRSETLWVRPNIPLSIDKSVTTYLNKSILNKKILIIDIGTSSIRAGLYNNEPKLPKMFFPTVCARDFTNQLGKLRVGFEAFDSVLASSAPSTINLNTAQSTWSLNSTTSLSGAGPNHLIFPFKNKKAIDKLSMDLETIDSIIEYIVETLNITCFDHQIIVITPQKFSDKLNVQFLNLLLVNEKYQFEAASLMNQTLMSLYSYNSTVGIVANLGEKIDIVPICNGVAFQGGVSNLAYGGSTMSEYLNAFISRGHQNYVNSMEQYFVRYIKEKACYAAINYKDELNKFPSENMKYKLELNDQVNDFKKIEFPETARFKSVEGLFNPEIWGIDGKGIHKLIYQAIQSSSMDLRREMARSIYLCGGMSRIPGLKERLEYELKQLLPPTITVKVNCSDYSYHSAFLGAHKFINQPEYQNLVITRDEWSNENVNCLRKWRMI